MDSLHEACEDAEEYLKNLTAKDLAAIVLALAVILSAPGIVAAVVVVARQAIVRKLGSEAAKRIDEAVAAQKPTEPPPPKPQTVKPTSVLRQKYEQEVKALAKLEKEMRSQGKSSEEIARTLSRERRRIGEKYKERTPKEIREKIYDRNQKKYGDKLGPTVDYLRRQGKSWDDIIESAKRPDGSDIINKQAGGQYE